MVQKKRIDWIDLLRVFAIFVVLLVHSVEKIYKFDLDYMLTVPGPSRIIAFSMFTLGRLGVPIFLMISGYLLLDREYDEKKTKVFWKEKWLHLLICTEIWLVIYELFLAFYLGERIGILQFFSDLFFIHGIKISHMWYMPMILGVYILIPFVSKAVRSFNNKLLIFPIVIYSVFAFGYPLFNMVCRILLNKELSLQFSLGFSGGCYGIYLLMGYFLKQGGLKKVRLRILATITIIFFGLGVGFQLWAYENNFRYNIWYDNLFIFITSVALFELASRISHIPGYKLIKWLSSYSFAVYLIHNIFRISFADYINAMNLGRTMKTVLLWLITGVVSYSVVWIISKIPKIGKYILYMK